ncbi:MAG: RNA 2',3'-cyclic phosphodiesterase [Candidatus Auribacterota bacterium]|nr:RNA 2',3'-cyclic phosphodiesterase [Candidatus Auribacterota bacterium]
MKIRTFIAIGVPEKLKAEIGKISSFISSQIPGVRWVSSENLHITLKFLGDIEESMIPDIQEVLNQVAQNHLPISSKFGGVGVFPNIRRPGIIWLGLTEGSEELTVLVSDISAGLSRLGFKPERRKFTPHLTLGRVKKRVRPAGLREILETDEGKFSTGRLKINMLLLKKSTLTSNGAIHQILSEHYMNGRV